MVYSSYQQMWITVLMDQYIYQQVIKLNMPLYNKTKVMYNIFVCGVCLSYAYCKELKHLFAL